MAWPTCFCSELKEQLCSFCYHTWQARLESSARLSTYNTYKSCFDKDKCVDLTMAGYKNISKCFGINQDGVVVFLQINERRYRFSQTAETVYITSDWLCQIRIRIVFVVWMSSVCSAKKPVFIILIYVNKMKIREVRGSYTECVKRNSSSSCEMSVLCFQPKIFSH